MRVRVFQVPRAVDQGGGAGALPWVVEPLRTQKPEREPLMGWLSAPDALSTFCRGLCFSSQAAALAFARGQGWLCEVLPASAPRIRPRSFIDNFRIVRPEDEERQAAESARNQRRS